MEINKCDSGGCKRPPMITDRTLIKEEIRELSNMLTEGFLDDPLFSEIFSIDKEKRRKEISALMKVGIKYCNLFGGVHFFDDFSGVTLWIPPAVPFPSVKNALKNGFIMDFINLIFQISLKSLINLIKASSVIEKSHKENMNEPHYYLFAIVIDAKVRGIGLGKQLMNYAINKYGTNERYYLENSKRRNIKFYNAMGFKIVSSGKLGNSDIFYMTRNQLQKSMASEV
jgi:GNAT superfamily N-acetyltransferase